MSAPQRNAIEPLPGFQSREVALFFAQLDDQSRRLLESIQDITPEELAWQSKPGMNTIGMLLAHEAIVDVWWSVIASGADPKEAEEALGIPFDTGDGMPLPEDGLPPASLRGKDRAYFEELLARARRIAKEQFQETPDSDLEREILRTRADGSQRLVTVRWILYHMLEHFAGHFGQILLLRHAYRASRVPEKV